MVIMDFNGITWVADVYQKFEALCLEVEEIIVQDTAKYVENQVQTVGASVKKFYSDVVQDLRSESLVDSVKPSPVFPIHEYSPLCSLEKKETISDDEGSREFHNSKGKNGGSPSLNFQLSSKISPSKGPYVESYGKTCDGNTRKRTKLGAKRISKKENSCHVTRTGNHVKKDLPDGSTVRGLSNSGGDASCDLEIASSKGPKEEVHMLTSNTVEPFGTKEPKMEKLLAENDGVAEVDCQPTLWTKTDIKIEDCHDTGTAHQPGGTDEQKADTTRKGAVSDLNHGNVEHHRQNPLEESCILVNQDDVYYVPCTYSKRSPIKKNIRDAISARMRSARKNEYKQLALQWHTEEDDASNQCLRDNPKPIPTQVNQPSSSHTCESDWEIL